MRSQKPFEKIDLPSQRMCSDIRAYWAPPTASVLELIRLHLIILSSGLER